MYRFRYSVFPSDFGPSVFAGLPRPTVNVSDFDFFFAFGAVEVSAFGEGDGFVSALHPSAFETDGDDAIFADFGFGVG